MFYTGVLGQVFEDPVVAADGHTYERWAIEEWLKQHSNSPKTRQFMTNDTLQPNHAIKSLVDDWHESQAKNPEPATHIPFDELKFRPGSLRWGMLKLKPAFPVPTFTFAQPRL